VPRSKEVHVNPTTYSLWAKLRFERQQKGISRKKGGGKVGETMSRWTTKRGAKFNSPQGYRTAPTPASDNLLEGNPGGGEKFWERSPAGVVGKKSYEDRSIAL